jgi:hypothetical protein
MFDRFERATPSSDVAPRAIVITASGSPHGLGTAIYVNRVSVVSAIVGATPVRLARHYLAIATVVGVSPTSGNTGLAPLQGRKFGLLGEHTILLIHRLADLTTDDPSDDRASDCREDVALSFTDLIADNTARDGTDSEAAILLRYVAIPAAGAQAKRHGGGNNEG